MTTIDEYQYNGFKYLIDYSKEGNLPIIEHSKPIPEFLFKFYSMSEYSLDSISDGYLYSSHPIELNDCLDSSPFLLFSSKPIDFELYDKFFGFAYENNKQELYEYWKNDCKPENLCKGYISHMYNVAFNLVGIISMTAKENNPLMWPHYTQEKGFQLKFRTIDLENDIRENLGLSDGEYLGLHPMNYSKVLNPIDISLFKTFHIPITYATNVKSDKWQYEEEWRFLISKHNMGVPFSKSGLNLFPDYYVNIENRYAKYNISLIEEICLGLNFFTREEFDIDWLSDWEFTVKPKKSERNCQYENHLKFLNLLADELNEKIYYSGIKYELDDQNKHFLIRTKEQLEITKQKNNSFKFKRTSKIIKLVD